MVVRQGAPHALVSEFTSAFASCDKDDVRMLHKLASVASEFLRARAEAFIRDRPHDPVCVVYGSDCTPLRTRERWLLVCDGCLVVRSSRKSSEWLIQRLFIYDHLGRRVCLVPDPVPMSDKTVWTHFQAQRQLLRLPRELGHRGIAIHHHVWDGAVHSACTKATRRFHEALHQHQATQMSSGEAVLSRLRSWVTSICCVLHVCHNAQKWSILGALDRSMCRDCWVVCESLLNSQHLLMSFFDEWVDDRIIFSSQEFDALGLWWLLGASGDGLDLLVELRLRWDGEKLVIAAEWEKHDQLLPKLRCAVMAVFRFRAFSSSRWCGISQTARCLVGGACVGLPSLVTFVLNRCTDSEKYYLQGFSRYSKEMKHILGVVVCSCAVADSVLHVLQDDDRLLRQLPVIEEELKIGLDYVSKLPAGALGFVGEVVGVRVERLRHEAMQAALVQAAHIRSALRVAHEHPWSLATGDIEENLRLLANGPRPREETAQKVYDLLDVGVDIQEVAAGLRLLLDTPWSSESVEQGHAATSRVLRYHKQVGGKTAQSRATVMHLAPLMSPPEEHVKIEKLQKRIERLKRFQANRITGRHVFFADLQQLTKVQRDNGRAFPADSGKKLTAKHGKRWKALPVIKKATFSSRAQQLRDERRECVAEEVVECQAAVKILQLRQREVAQGGPVCRLGACRLSPAEMAAFDQMYSDGKWTQAYVDELRAKALQCIGPPPRAEQEVLMAMPIWKSDAPPRAPAWAAWLAHHRADMTGAIFKYERNNGAIDMFKFVYAMQNPIFFAMLALRTATEAESLAMPIDDHADGLWEWRQCFMCDAWNLVYSDSGDFDDDAARVFVLLDSVHMSGGLIVSSDQWVPLEWLLMHMDWPERNGSDKPSAPDLETPLDELPEWVEEQLLWDPGEWLSFFEQKTPAPRHGSASAAVAKHDTLAECDVEDVMDELLKKREEVSRLAPTAGAFRLILRGGAFTQMMHGVAYDTFRAEAMPGIAVQFCMLFGLTKSASFACRLYGEDDCISLARGWIARMQHFFDEWEAQGGAETASLGRSFAAVPEPPEFAELLARGSGAAWERAQQIRRVLPCR